MACYSRWLTAQQLAGRDLADDRYGVAWLCSALNTLNNHGRTQIQKLLAREALMKAAGLAGQLRGAIRLLDPAHGHRLE